uniref:Tripartite motif containing 77 n=1 Tax=Rhinolophus ferrumequinum TaxID=59479 RepID=A0A671FVI5_RHIFE
FIDPVTIGCGHSFCMPCLCISWEEAPHPPRCPVCRETSHQMNFKTNIVLKTRTFLARRARLLHLPGSAVQMCQVHMQTKKFFCEVIKDLLCVLCSKSKEHVAHRHCSIDWVAEEYRQRLLEQMRCVWKKTKENQRNLNRETSKMETWEVSKRFCFLHESVQLHMPQPVHPQLSSWPITGLIDRLSRFLVHISLDHERVTDDIPLFKGLRSWLFSSDPPDMATITRRCFLAWGDQPFLSGQHYWEVDVASCSNWVIGFCNDSWAGRDDMTLKAGGMFLLLCVKGDDRCILFTSSSPLLPHYVERPVGHVGVFLDYECGVVSFVNVADSSLICSFLSCSFSSPLRPFLYSEYP